MVANTDNQGRKVIRAFVERPTSSALFADLEMMMQANGPKPPPRRGVTRQPRGSIPDSATSTITIRLDFGALGALGPGKIRLLELVAQLGSIAAAGKALGMSYRRAWLLIDSMNRVFSEPLVNTRAGGAQGGGAGVTVCGTRVIDAYRAIERAAASAASSELASLAGLLAPVAPEQKTASSKNDEQD